MYIQQHINTVGRQKPMTFMSLVGPPRGGPMLYAIWLFYGFAICYKKINTAIIN